MASTDDPSPEARWCPDCGEQRVSPPWRYCNGCGAPQDKEEE